MPHVNHTVGNSAISPIDEIKVYQDEGEGEEEQKSSAENLKEVKSSLVTEEEEKSIVRIPHPSYISPKNITPVRPTDHRSSLPPPGKHFDYFSPSPFGYVVSSYPHHNGALGPLSMVNRVPLVPSNHGPSSLSLMMYNADFQPPPAHIGISPVHVDPKTGIRTPVYPLPPTSQFHPPVFSPDFTQQFPWPHHSVYSFPSGFRSPPYPPPFHHANHLSSKFSSPPLTSSHSVILPSLSHHSLVGPKTPSPQDTRSFSQVTHHNQNHNSSINSSSRQNQKTERERASDQNSAEKKDHIKKPLNAFMLFMKEQRAQVVAECALKESAAINQLLGKKWHSLSRDEQSKYYELAKKERQVHMQMYPGWTARDNYAVNVKKKKRKRDKSQEGDSNNPKKCRARFGLDRQSDWCKPCRRKKKCIRYISGSDNTGESEDNIGSVESLGSMEAPTPDSRFGGDNTLSDSDSGHEDDDLEVSSEFSLSSPPVPRPHGDNVQLNLSSPPSQHLPLSIQHSSRPADCLGSPEGQLPPTPPSTDSSTTTAPPLLAVT